MTCDQREDRKAPVYHDQNVRKGRPNGADEIGSALYHSSITARVLPLKELGRVKRIKKQSIKSVLKNSGNKVFNHAPTPVFMSQVDESCVWPVCVRSDKQALGGELGKIRASGVDLTQAEIAQVSRVATESIERRKV